MDYRALFDKDRPTPEGSCNALPPLRKSVGVCPRLGRGRSRDEAEYPPALFHGTLCVKGPATAGPEPYASPAALMYTPVIPRTTTVLTQGHRIWPEGFGVCAGNRVQLSGAGGREVDEESEGKKGTEFSPRVPIDSHIFPFCQLIRVISYLRHCSGTRIFKFGPIPSHSRFSWRLGSPCLCGCRLTPAGAQRDINRH